MNKTFDFFGKRKIFFTISLSIFAIGLIFNFIFGTQLDVQFKGGTEITYSYEGDINFNDVKSTVNEFVKGEVSIKSIEDKVNGMTKMVITCTDQFTPQMQENVTNKLRTTFASNNLNDGEVNSVDPSMGSAFFGKGIVAIIVACALMIIYIAIRFKKLGWSAGVFAVVALIHDLLLAYFTFVVFKIPLDNNFIAVVLTILGYSLNDTIVIYDRIRENQRLLPAKTPLSEIVNVALNKVFRRSLNTSITTAVAIGCVCVISLIYGLRSITSFALPMLIGVISGCYSSLFIAAPLWVMWKTHLAKKKTAGNNAKKSK